MKASFLFLYLSLFNMISTSAAIGQMESQSFKDYEVIFGFGGAVSFEKDIFNVPDDAKGSPDVAINLGFLRHINEQFAAGVQLYGYIQKINNYGIVQSGTPKSVNFEFSTFNLSGHARWIISRETFEPYAFAVLGYANGSIESSETGTLNYTGFSAGAGAGAGVSVGSGFVLSLEGIASFGSAKWSQKPFLNSTGDELNPSMIGLMVNISYRW